MGTCNYNDILTESRRSSRGTMSSVYNIKLYTVKDTTWSLTKIILRKIYNKAFSYRTVYKKAASYWWYETRPYPCGLEPGTRPRPVRGAAQHSQIKNNKNKTKQTNKMHRQHWHDTTAKENGSIELVGYYHALVPRAISHALTTFQEKSTPHSKLTLQQ